MKNKLAVVILNFHSTDDTIDAVESVMGGSLPPHHIVIVDNSSTIESREALEHLRQKHAAVTCLYQKKNHGFAGGVNIGMRWALEQKCAFIALLNNDAVASKRWLETLHTAIASDDSIGIVTSKITNYNGDELDSTGDFYTVWGLSFPRGRGEKDLHKYDNDLAVFAGSGGGSLYRAQMLKRIGLMDPDFFAYYEDVDLSFRAQLAGWHVRFAPKATIKHKIGASSGSMKSGFTTYQSFKNIPLVYIRNVPGRMLLPIGIRLWFAYTYFLLGSFRHRNAKAALSGWLRSLTLLPKKIVQRRGIQKQKVATNAYLASIIVRDLPPSQHGLRRLRDRLRLRRS